MAITANTTYVASYHSNGYYSATGNFFASADVNGTLTAPASSTSGGNGVYAYGSAVTFPTSTYGATNYWVDVLFSPTVASGSSLFTPSSTPATVTENDPNSVELGVKFSSSTGGHVTALSFYKGPQNVGPHTVHLWNASGNLLASATSANETASGWQTVSLATPVAITANTTYVASYHSNGYYSVNDNFFARAYVNGTLTAPASSASGGNGVYAYGSAVTFPTSTYGATNYWVDVAVQ